MKKTAIAIQHAAHEDLGNLAPALREHGFDIHYLYADRDNLAIDPLQPDLLVVLGGPMGVYEQEKFPFLTQEINLLKTRLKADLPTIGICLGSQLMASALGAKVYPGHAREIGWSAISLSAAGKNSPLAALKHPVLHWHGDTFDLPKGAIHLAESPLYKNQAFMIGENGLALQFHPEITASQVHHWLAKTNPDIDNMPEINWHQVEKDTQNHVKQAETQAIKFWNLWLSKSN